jgi:hypothetical protein
MNIIDALLGEHGVFYAQFDYIEREVSDDTPVEEIRAIATLLAAALGPHAQMEDDLLFRPALEAGAAGGPMGVMMRDHEDIEASLEDARRAGDAHDAWSFLLDAVHAAREHFGREEQIAFLLAEQALGEARLRELGARWADSRGVALEATS